VTSLSRVISAQVPSSREGRPTACRFSLRHLRCTSGPPKTLGRMRKGPSITQRQAIRKVWRAAPFARRGPPSPPPSPHHEFYLARTHQRRKPSGGKGRRKASVFSSDPGKQHDGLKTSFLFANFRQFKGAVGTDLPGQRDQAVRDIACVDFRRGLLQLSSCPEPTPYKETATGLWSWFEGTVQKSHADAGRRPQSKSSPKGIQRGPRRGWSGGLFSHEAYFMLTPHPVTAGVRGISRAGCV